MLAVVGTWGYGAAWPILLVTLVGACRLLWIASESILRGLDPNSRIGGFFMPNRRIEPLYILLLAMTLLFLIVVPFQWALDTIYG